MPTSQTIGAPAEHNITAWRGSDIRIPLALTDGDGAAIDLTGWEWQSSIARLDGTLVDTTWTIETVDAEEGTAMMSLESEVTTEAEEFPHQTRYEVWRVDAAGDRLPLMHGTFTVLPSSTEE